MTLRGRIERYLWVMGGAIVTIGALLVLGTWLPVSTAVAAAWFVLVFLEWGLPDSPWRPQPWLYPIGFTLVYTGLGLLLGAAEGDRPRDHLVAGVVLGVALFVVGVVIAVVGQRRFSNRAVADEIERERERERQRDGALGRDRDR